MSDSIEVDESQSFYENSDGGGSVTSSIALRPNRPRPTQIMGMAWVLRGEITININQQLRDSLNANFQNTKSQLQAALGAKFENRKPVDACRVVTIETEMSPATSQETVNLSM